MTVPVRFSCNPRRSPGRRRRRIACALTIAVSVVAMPMSVCLQAAPKPATETEPGDQKIKPNKKDKGAVEVIMSDPERQRFEEFMKNNSPKKFATYQQFRARVPDKTRTRALEAGLTNRFRELEKIRQTDTERHAFEVQAIKIEDDAYGVLQEIHAGKTQSPDQADKRLRELAAAFVDNRRAWREVRIQRVKEELKRLGLKKAIVAIQESAKEDETQKTKTREEQITQLVTRWRQGANPPKLKGALPPGERPPTEETPTTVPTNAPANQ